MTLGAPQALRVQQPVANVGLGWVRNAGVYQFCWWCLMTLVGRVAGGALRVRVQAWTYPVLRLGMAPFC